MKIKNINYLPVLFLISLFLLKLPPFYWFIIPNKIFSSHSLAKIILLFTFTFLVFKKRKRVKSILKSKKKVITLISLFIFFQSISIIKAYDIFLFLKNFHNLVFSLIIFLLTLIFIKMRLLQLKIINNFLLFTGLIVILLELSFLIFPNQILNIFSTFIQKEVLDTYFFNFERGRPTLELDSQVFFPIYLGNLLFNRVNKPYYSIFFTFVSLIIFFQNVVSNTRTILLSSIIALILMLIFYFLKQKKKVFKVFILLLNFLIIGIIAIRLSKTLFSYTVIDRVLLDKEVDTGGSIVYRIQALLKSLEIFKSSPLIGIGLGNFVYFNPMPTFIKYQLLTKPYQKTYADLVWYEPHNLIAKVLSETGILGLLSLIILLSFFFIKDFKCLFQYKKTKHQYIFIYFSYIISSWSFIIFGFFNPISTLFKIGWFWFLRGIIEALDIRKIKPRDI